MTSITEENVKPENAERYSGEIKDLLLVAQNQFFDDDAEVVREKEDFEKLDSFFELVQKDNLSTPKEVNETHDEPREEVPVESLEDISEDLERTISLPSSVVTKEVLSNFILPSKGASILDCSAPR